MSLPKIVQAVNARVSLAGDESISDVKTYTDSPVVPDVVETDFSQKTANTRFVKTAVRHAVDDLQRQINELEGTVLTATEDSTTAYTKAVPVSADLFKYAAIRNFGGRSLVWNQLATYATQTITGYSVTASWDASSRLLTFNGTASGTGQIGVLSGGSPLIVGHKVLFLTNAPYEFRLGGTDTLYQGGGIYTISNPSASTNLIVKYYEGVSYSGSYPVTICDLTLMFGAGNEPATVADFLAIFPNDIPAFNAGEIKSAAVTNIRSNIYSWDAIKKAVNKETIQQYLKIGDLLYEDWTDVETNVTDNLAWGVRHFGNFTLQNGVLVPGMVLQSHYVIRPSIQFSRSRAFLACPTGLVAGTYYFSFGTYNSGKVTSGSVVQFTIAADVPAGGRLAMNNALGDVNKSGWRVYVYGADGKTLIETITPTVDPETPSGTDLGTMQAQTRQGNLNCAQETVWGWNEWFASAHRQYLNSDQGKGLWWTPYDGWDVAPSALDTYAGFLTGVPEEMLEAIQPVRVRTYLNNVDATAYSKQYEDTVDRFFLPSMNQMYANPQVADEGESWDYWKALATATIGTKWAQGGTYPQLRSFAIENRASAQTVRWRSAFRGNSNTTWRCYSSGHVYDSTACYAYRPCPACVIAKHP